MISVIHVVCGVIQGDDGRVLACRRGFDRHLGGLWEFPGGKVDEGEEAEDALRRELQEELGVLVGVGDRLGPAVEWTDGQVSIRLEAFRCVVVQGEPVALEHEEIRWCLIPDLRNLKWAEADVPLVEILIVEQGNACELGN